MNKLSSILLIALLLVATSCDKTKQTPNGFKYKVIKAGNGILPKTGEVLVFDYVMKDSKDSVWSDTRKTDTPAAVMIADSSALQKENGMVQMFRQLSVGDSITVEMPVKQFFKDIVGGPVPKEIDSTINISYLINVKEITNRNDYMVKQQEKMRKLMEIQLGKDTVAIDSFLVAKGITPQKTETGIRYVITQPGKGPNAASAEKVTVNYTGYLLNGKYFDTSVKAVAEEKGLFDPRREPYKPFELTIDRSGVIKGWHESLKLLNKGAKGTFYIPSSLGYGPQAMSEVLKPNSVLVFDIEMLDIQPEAFAPKK
jgi:FKBP-type peptidyl-prolyl cis-trans isomerase FkpA